MSKPTIVFVPGLWEGAAPFILTARKLQELGYRTSIATLPSLGSTSPGGPNFDDDVAAVRTFIEPFVRRDHNVVLVCHSFGGVLGPAAIHGLTCKEQADAGKKGGVATIAFVCAGVSNQGQKRSGPLPFFDIKDGVLWCKSPRELLFSDIDSDTVAQQWLDLAQRMPAEYFSEVKHAGWSDVPCHYLICEEDRLLPVQVQENSAASVNATIERCDSGHMVQISQPETLVKFIEKAAGSILEGGVSRLTLK